MGNKTMKLQKLRKAWSNSYPNQNPVCCVYKEAHRWKIIEQEPSCNHPPQQFSQNTIYLYSLVYRVPKAEYNSIILFLFICHIYIAKLKGVKSGKKCYSFLSCFWQSLQRKESASVTFPHWVKNPEMRCQQAKNNNNVLFLNPCCLLI